MFLKIIYSLTRKGQESYSNAEWLQSVKKKGGLPSSFIVDSLFVIINNMSHN